MCQKKLRRKLDDSQIAVAPPLQPFVKEPSARDLGDIQDGIYNFLSPSLLPLLTTPSSFSQPIPTDCSFIPESSSDLLVPPPISKIVELPEWYQKGQNVDALLKEADGLNWLEDSQKTSVQTSNNSSVSGQSSFANSLPHQQAALYTSHSHSQNQSHGYLQQHPSSRQQPSAQQLQLQYGVRVFHPVDDIQQYINTRLCILCLSVFV